MTELSSQDLPLASDPVLVDQRFPYGGALLSGILFLILAGVVFVLDHGGLLPFVISAGSTALAGEMILPLLRWLKTGQVIREDGPQSHLSKAGTPTMGGIYFIPVGLAVGLIATHADSEVIAVCLLTLASGFIGWLDDWQVIRKKSNKGITPRQKLILQLAIGIGFCSWLAWTGVDWGVLLPGLGLIPLSWAFWLLALFVLVGSNNATNLTDGMDGLAAGVVAVLLIGLGLILAPHQPQLAILALALSGSCIGFLAHNRHPAQVFMGDTGSLALGGSLAALALLGNCVWALALMGGVLVAESLSVILQVSYFKYTKRQTGLGQRLFRMAPFHHHLELGGWSEIQVVSTFYGITAGLVGLGYWIGR